MICANLMNMRKAVVQRKTRETDILLEIALDGGGDAEVSTGIGFFDHMLTLLSHHAGFDLKLEAKGDLEVDQHHTVEDVGICLGGALREALGDKKGVARYGWALLPMDEALCLVALDLSGRPHLSYEVELPMKLISDFDPACARAFLQALANGAGLTLHVRSMCGDNPHHVLEAVFKGVGRSLRAAVSRKAASRDIPSTKGIL